MTLKSSSKTSQKNLKFQAAKRRENLKNKTRNSVTHCKILNDNTVTKHHKTKPSLALMSHRVKL